MAGSVTVGIRALVDVRQFQLFPYQGVNVADIGDNVRWSGAGCSVSMVASVTGFRPYTASNNGNLVGEWIKLL
jgi:hypothetical protein